MRSSRVGGKAFAGLYGRDGSLHGDLKPIDPRDPDAFERLVDLLEDAFIAFGIDRTAADAALSFAVKLASLRLPAFRREGAEDQFGSKAKAAVGAGPRKPRSNAVHDLEFMTLTTAFLEGSRDGNGAPLINIGEAQRRALGTMIRDYGEDKVGSAKTMKRIWNRKRKAPPDVSYQISVMDDLYFEDLTCRALRAVLDPEFMEARAFAREHRNRGH